LMGEAPGEGRFANRPYPSIVVSGCHPKERV
jgi:hypothetical protein